MILQTIPCCHCARPFQQNARAQRYCSEWCFRAASKTRDASPIDCQGDDWPEIKDAAADFGEAARGMLAGQNLPLVFRPRLGIRQVWCGAQVLL